MESLPGYDAWKTSPPDDSRADREEWEGRMEEEAWARADAAEEDALQWESIMRAGGDAPREEDAPELVHGRTLFTARISLGLDREDCRG